MADQNRAQVIVTCPGCGANNRIREHSVFEIPHCQICKHSLERLSPWRLARRPDGYGSKDTCGPAAASRAQADSSGPHLGLGSKILILVLLTSAVPIALFLAAQGSTVNTAPRIKTAITPPPQARPVSPPIQVRKPVGAVAPVVQKAAFAEDLKLLEPLKPIPQIDPKRFNPTQTDPKLVVDPERTQKIIETNEKILKRNQKILDGVQTDLKRFESPKYAEAPEPVPLPTDRKLRNGTMINSRRLNGAGQLQVDNGLPNDAVVKVVSTDTDDCIAFFYVASNSAHKIKGIPDGDYKLMFCSGYDWDKKARCFTRDKRKSKFREPSTFTTTRERTSRGILRHSVILRVTLHRVPHGNAKADPISDAEFDRYD